MDDLVTWLRAALDDDEREINRHPVGGVDWADDPVGYMATAEQNYPCEPLLTVGKAFALAEVGAKRRILDAHFPVDPCDAHDAMSETIACDTLRLLAVPYAGRPGYDESWRP